MATPTIKIDQAGQAAGVAGLTRSDLVVGSLVTATDPANPGGPWAWELVPPAGSASVLNNPAVSSPTFTPDIAGTYLLYLTAGGTASFTLDANGDKVSTQGGAAVLMTNGVRIPGIKETKQFGTSGWAPADDNFRRTLPVKQTGSSITADGHERAKNIVYITDFAPLGTTNWRAAVVAALAALVTKGGGTLRFPTGTFDIDCTGLGAITWSGSKIVWEGEGKEATIIRNVSSDGTDLLSFAGGAVSVQNCGFRKFSLVSEVSAGHLITFASKGLSYTFFISVNVHQKNPLKAIWKGTYAVDGGCFENIFDGGNWEHGTTNNPARVPAFDVQTDSNLFTNNRFAVTRYHCHDSTTPFFSIKCSAAASFNRGNYWAGPVNVEGCRRGFIYLESHQNGVLGGPFGFYDSPAAVDGHFIELATGTGGQPCDHNTFNSLMRNVAVATISGAAEAKVSVTTLVQAAGVATCTTSAPHGYLTGDTVDFEGATPAAYNGNKSITVTGASTFTFTIAGGTASPATGTIQCARVGRVVTSINRSSSVATVVTTAAHGLETGQQVYMAGANQSEYNGLFQITVTSSTSFTYTVSGTPATPATGTIIHQESAKLVKLSTSTKNTIFVNCGTTIANQIDVNKNGYTSIGDSKLEFYRKNTSSPNWVQIQMGNTDPVIEAPDIRAASITSLDGGPIYAPFGVNAPPAEDWDVSVTRDGPVQSGGLSAALPQTGVEWLKVGWPIADSSWNGGSVASGDIPSLMVDGYELSPDGTLDYQQAVSGWTRTSVKFTETVGEALKIKPSANPYNPVTASVAALGYIKLGTSGSATALMTLGTSLTGVGSGGIMVRLAGGGQIILRVDGVNVQGTAVYENDGLVHPFLVVLDHENERVTLYTDLETVEGVWSNTIVDANSKGFGGAGSLTPPVMDLVFGAWFYGSKAKQLAALGRNALAKLGWYQEIVEPGPRAFEKFGVNGLNLARNPADGSQLTIEAGGCRSDDDILDITVPTQLTLDLDVHMDTGSKAADTKYYVWLFGDSTENNAASGRFSLSASAPTVPAGYDKKRRIGFLKTDGSSNIMHFVQIGNGRRRRYEWDQARSVIIKLNAQGNATFQDLDLSSLIPSIGKVRVDLMVAINPVSGGGAAAGDGLELRAKGANSSDGPFRFNGVVVNVAQYGRAEMVTDSAGVIQWRTTHADDDASIWVLGYYDEI